MLTSALQVPAWVPVTALGVSLISLLVAAFSLWLTYERDQREKERDRKKVDIVNSIERRIVAVIDVAFYRCTVTNIGVPGVKIRRVGLRSHGSAGAEIPLELASGEEERVLGQGDSQVWETPLDELRAAISGPNFLKVVAVATDTAGDQYVQDQSKSLTLPLGD